MKNALEIRNIKKIYPLQPSAALDSISFNVEKGDFFALLGPNGSGKTTLIGMISALIKTTSGEISIFGLDHKTDWLKVRALVGVVPQEINFNPFETVEDIVISQAGFYGIERKSAIVKAEYYLKKLDLWSKHDKLARTLSGGMKRRLMLARALVHEPKLLILDEPTAGVDIELRYLMWDFLAELNRKGVTIILTTHYLEEAEFLCRGVAIINKGKLLTTTTVRELVSQLHNQTVIIRLNHPVINLPIVQDFHLKILDSYTLSASYPKGQLLNQLFSSLSKSGIEVVNIHNKTNQLEEFFVQLLEKSL